jgi:predicted Zn-dependent peptidase
MAKRAGRFSFTDVYSQFSVQSLPNGLKVHHLFLPGADFMHVAFLIRCGSRQNPADRPGLAHFVEHLASKNCAISKPDIESFFRGYGGKFNLGETGPESTVYGFSLPADNETVLNGLRLFFSMIFTTLREGMEQERAIVINESERNYGDRLEVEMRVREADKVFYWHDFYKNAFFALGRKNDILAITEGDVDSFRERYYIPANTDVVMVGGMKEPEAISVLNRAGFSWRKEGDVISLPKPADPKMPLESLYVSPLIALGRDQVINCRCLSTLPVTETTVPMVACRIIDNVLEKRLREGKFNLYNSSSDWLNSTDFFQVWIDLDAVPGGRIEEVSAAIDSCLDEASLDKDLFAKVKEWSLAGYTINDQSGKDIIVSATKCLKVFGRIRSLTESYETLQRLSFGSVSAFIDDVRARLWKGFLRTS